MAVPELYKTAWCAIGKGCKVYPDRPEFCRDFNCGSLMAPYMGEELKPERCHVVFCMPYDAHTIVANCDPPAPDAWRTPHVIKMLHFLARVFPQRIVLAQVGAAQRARPAGGQEEEQRMNRKKKAFVAISVAVAWSFLGTASAVAKDDMGGGMDRSDRGEPSGSVVPCSLKGINPAAHPEIFGNPAVAASYGFVRSRNGTWYVRPGCRR